MPRNLNLALDVSTDAKGAPTARVYVSLATSYLKGQGAPTITADCPTFAALENEVRRLESECRAILQEARDWFDEVPEVPAHTLAEAEPPGQGAATRPTLEIAETVRVGDQMTREVETLHRNDRVSMADELMKLGHFRHVVVLDDDDREVVGVLSQRDIFFSALAWATGRGRAAHDKALAAFAVKDIMRGDVVTVTPETPLAEAAGLMLEKKIGCLPVVDQSRLVGILTEGDFLSILTTAHYAEEKDRGRAD